MPFVKLDEYTDKVLKKQEETIERKRQEKLDQFTLKPQKQYRSMYLLLLLLQMFFIYAFYKEIESFELVPENARYIAGMLSLFTSSIYTIYLSNLLSYKQFRHSFYFIVELLSVYIVSVYIGLVVLGEEKIDLLVKVYTNGFLIFLVVCPILYLTYYLLMRFLRKISK